LSKTIAIEPGLLELLQKVSGMRHSVCGVYNSNATLTSLKHFHSAVQLYFNLGSIQ